jgi:hypothetical protein
MNALTAKISWIQSEQNSTLIKVYFFGVPALFKVITLSQFYGKKCSSCGRGMRLCSPGVEYYATE